MGLAGCGTVSERHAEARHDANKLTAGELAEKMRKAGLDVSAAELKPLAPEWHHSGWIPGPRRFGGSKMGRTYFFPADVDINVIYADVLAARDRQITEKAEADVTVHYESILRSTKKASLYKIAGREVWIGDFMVKSQDFAARTLTLSARVAREKELANVE